MDRREFIKTGLFAAVSSTATKGFAALPGNGDGMSGRAMPGKTITIAKTSCGFEREPMIRPFGFKGGYLTEEWIVSAFVASTSGKHGIGLGTQSCLWSDAKVFAANSEAGGNAIMFSMTQYALKLLVGKTFTSPVELNDWLWPQVWEYGKKVSANPDLRATYALNALVAVDNAIWVLFAKENGLSSFDDMIPDAYRPALAARHAKCASIPLFSYKVPVAEIKEAVDSGYFFMKIKIGQPGTQEEMLAKDMARVSEIHSVLKDCRTPYTKTGKLPYYFDANGRYEKKETFLKFIDHLKKIGAYDQVAIVEEPFDEYADIDVNDIPLRLAADESAHTVKDALERIQMGYRAMALKPIAKTIREGRILSNLAKRHKTVFQVGSQQRNWSQFQAAVKAVRSGVLADIKRVEVGLGTDPAGGSSIPQKIPATFDYQTWLGPTDPSAPYCESRCHSQTNQRARPGWIELMPYGWGMITNWGAHHLDIARWGLGAVGPESVCGTCTWLDTSGGKLWNVHEHYDLHFAFNGGKTDVHASDKYQNGVKFVGEKGDWIFCTRGAFKVTPTDPDPVVKPGELGPLEASRPELLPKMWAMKKSCLQLHVDDWLEAIAANDPSLTATNAEEGHRSTALSSLGMMCMELGRGRKDGFSLNWDTRRETTGKAEYDALMKPFASGKFDLNVNLAEFGMDFCQVLKQREARRGTTRSAPSRSGSTSCASRTSTSPWTTPAATGSASSCRRGRALWTSARSRG